MYMCFSVPRIVQFCCFEQPLIGDTTGPRARGKIPRQLLYVRVCSLSAISSGTTRREAEDNYSIERRIEAEERGLDAATIVITSTHQEVEEQWGLYDG